MSTVSIGRLKAKKFFPYVVGITLCLSIGFLGGLVTAQPVKTWYPSLVKPFFTPPDQLFAPVWTLLYILLGIAWGTIWWKPHAAAAHKIFIIQLVFNAAWSPLFFGLQAIGLALVDILLLWVSAAVMLFYFWRVAKFSTLLVIPYFFWISYAVALNFAIWYLNKI